MQICFALVLAPRSVVSLSPFPHRRSFGNLTVPWDLERNFFPRHFMRLIHCLSWTKCWWDFWWTNCSHFLASSSNPGSPLSPSAHWHKTLSGQAWTRAGYRTEYYLVQKLPSTKYCIVVAALKYGILGSTKYFLTIVSTHCDCLVTIHLTTLKQFISGHLLFLKVSSERLGLGASFL